MTHTIMKHAALRAMSNLLFPVLLALSIASGCAKPATVSSAEAEALVANGAKLVDVRTPQEYQQGHIAGAINVPIDELPARMNELGNKDQALVLYCKAGKRAHRGAEALKQAGFTQVHELGAMKSWTGAGAP